MGRLRAAAAAATGLAGEPRGVRLLAPGGGAGGGAREVGAAWGGAEEASLLAAEGSALERALVAADALPLTDPRCSVRPGATLVVLPRRQRPDGALLVGRSFRDAGLRGSLVKHPSLAAHQPAGPGDSELNAAATTLARAEGLPDTYIPAGRLHLPEAQTGRGGGEGGNQSGGAATTPFDPIEVPPSLLRWLDAGGMGRIPERGSPGRGGSGDPLGEVWETDESEESDLGGDNEDDEEEEEGPPPPAPEPDASAIAQLQDMGFPSLLARKALQLRGGSVPGATEWLLSHADDSDAGAPLTDEELRRIAGPSQDRVRRAARRRVAATRRQVADVDSVEHLVEMGFDETLARRALRRTGNRVEMACQLLLQGWTGAAEEFLDSRADAGGGQPPSTGERDPEEVLGSELVGLARNMQRMMGGAGGRSDELLQRVQREMNATVGSAGGGQERSATEARDMAAMHELFRIFTGFVNANSGLSERMQAQPSSVGAGPSEESADGRGASEPDEAGARPAGSRPASPGSGMEGSIPDTGSGGGAAGNGDSASD